MSRSAWSFAFRHFVMMLVLPSGLLLTSCHASRHTTSSRYTPRTQASRSPAGDPGKASASEAHLDDISHARKKQLRETYGKMLNVSPGQIKDYRLYQFIDDWYGVPYKYGGTDETGVDCSGFAQQLYRQVYGYKLVRTSGQQYRSSKHRRRQRRLREGNLVFFNGGGDDISHVGVYLKNGYFVHSASSKGVMISNLNETYWKRSFEAGGKVRK